MKRNYLNIQNYVVVFYVVFCFCFFTCI